MAELTNFISAQLPCHPAGLDSSRRGRCREPSESSDGEMISPEVNGINNPAIHWDTKQWIGLSFSRRNLDRAGIKSSRVPREDTQGSLNINYTKII